MAILKTRKNLEKLNKSPKIIPNQQLLNFNPQGIEQFKQTIAELERRMGRLNLTTKQGADSYRIMQARVAELRGTMAGLTTASGAQQAQFLNTSRAAMHQTKAFAGLISMAKMYFGLFAMVRVVSNIQKITGEFEMQRIALGAIVKGFQILTVRSLYFLKPPKSKSVSTTTASKTRKPAINSSRIIA